MSERKQQIREAFRDAVYARAKYRCQGTRCRVTTTRAAAARVLDAHHITSRKKMPFDGYVVENGIALCNACHVVAEDCEQGRTTCPGWMPDDLYAATGSSRELASAAALQLGPEGELARRGSARR